MSTDTRMEWFDLQKRAQMQLKQARSGNVAPGDWDGLLMRFRKLREALTAAGAPARLRCEVYELSADVCAAADSMAELLKCLQQLVNNIYPALEQTLLQQQQQQHQQQQQPAEPADCSRNSPQPSQPQDSSSSSRLQSAWSDTSSSDTDGDGPGSNGSNVGSSSSSSSSRALQRLPEVAAALLLYFVCIPQRPVQQEIAKQLRSAAKPRQGRAPLIANPLYRQAVLDTAAALRCDWCRFLGSYCGQQQQQQPLLVKAVMGHFVERLRVQAVRKMGIAYRMLPTATLERWLQLQHSSSRPSSIVAGGAPAGSAVVAHHCVLSLLQRAAQEGSKAAGIAAASCAAEADTLPATLHFRPQ